MNKYSVWLNPEDLQSISDVCPGRAITVQQKYNSLFSTVDLLRIELLMTKDESLMLKLRSSKPIHFVRIEEIKQHE